MLAYISVFILGFVLGIVGAYGFMFYLYCRAAKQAHEEGWDMPS